jgi:hypothetical protein
LRVAGGTAARPALAQPHARAMLVRLIDEFNAGFASALRHAINVERLRA